MAIYGYCRVSTRGQVDGNSLEGQKDEILKYSNAIILKSNLPEKNYRPL